MLGKSVRNANAGELEDFSVVFFLWRNKVWCQREGGKMEMVLSVGGSYEDPQVFAGNKTPSLIKSAHHLKRRTQTMNEKQKTRLSTNLFNRTRTI